MVKWHWRDFGNFDITQGEAEKQARDAARMHQAAGLGEAASRVHFTKWVPWYWCKPVFAPEKESNAPLVDAPK